MNSRTAMLSCSDLLHLAAKMSLGVVRRNADMLEGSTSSSLAFILGCD